MKGVALLNENSLLDRGSRELWKHGRQNEREVQEGPSPSCKNRAIPPKPGVTFRPMRYKAPPEPGAPGQ